MISNWRKHARTGSGSSSLPQAFTMPGVLRQAPDQGGPNRASDDAPEALVTGPSTDDHAEHVRGKLTEQLQTLQLLERELKTEDDLRQRIRGDAVAVAIKHVRHAIDALELASRGLTMDKS
jgi:hypothetical protein